MSELKECTLGDVCHYVRDRRSADGLTVENYISTENLIPNKGGYTTASSVPEGVQVTEFHVGDVLVSNIRPYFKKIWQATFDSGCSNDVLVFRANDGIDSRWLNFVIANDRFFDHCMAGAKGCKMPRGDKQQIMEYPVNLPDLTTQKKIAAALGALDDKIELNRKMNANLESMAQALFKSWFVDFEPFGGQMPEGWRGGTFGDFTTIKRGKVITKDSMTPGAVPVVAAGLAPAYYTDKANVSWPSVTISQSGANAGYVWIHFEDIWASDCSYISKSESPYVYMGYLFLKHNDRRIRHMQHGAAQPHIHADDLLPLEFNVPTKEHADKFTELISPIFERMAVAENQNRTLAQLRDTLLPKLMSGELNVDDVKID